MQAVGKPAAPANQTLCKYLLYNTVCIVCVGGEGIGGQKRLLSFSPIFLIF